MNAKERTPLILIEEAIQLLRTSPATVYALYCAGTVPFMLALFSFCAEMSYRRNAVGNCAESALVVALTYSWMKSLQAFCCRELVRVYTGNVKKWWKPTTMLAIWARQTAYQPLGFFLKPLAWLLIFPVTYVSAFFQNLTVLGGAERSDVKKSWQLARLWPKQSYAVYGLLSLLAMIVFFDLYAIVLSIPFLLKILLGVESFLTRTYNWAFSPVLLIALAAAAYFVIDLLAKAIEVIRCCDGESLATGGDLLRRLAALPNNQQSIPALPNQRSVHALPLQKPSKPGTVCLLCVALLIALPRGAAGNPIETSSSRSEAREQPLNQPILDRQIEKVLQNPEYSWRERADSTPDRQQKSSFEQWMISIRQMLLSFGSWISRQLKSLLKPFELKDPKSQPVLLDTSFSSALLNALSYLLWAAFAGTLILFMIRLLKMKATKLPPSIVPLEKPDLADEEIEADQPPDNEWYAMAREKMAAGEFRQAQRALFLAILSYLASHRFITVERWKSNTDYEKELARKVKHLSELPGLFAHSRLRFERCWYGADNVTHDDVETYNGIYERIKHAAA